ncbi:hypothetical protein DMC30DRAFT_417465 [Rhodotorula diobovata]|uniref:Uncharacterized protein n=1 Tax=Rhodotorula diobovata TaxID=5288 RepID=A0A5C5FV62_9BASI|nr:hypothetical protein DMC30DRAFT_417465 [Rhodotorula diobovata]
MANLFDALMDIVRGLFRGQIALAEAAISLVRTVVGEGFHVVEGVVHFVFSNILVLGFLGAALVGWSMYQQPAAQGRVGTTSGAGRKKIA